MTYKEFIKNHLAKAMDYDKVAGVQCVDLIKYYLKEVFNISAGAWGDAYCYYTNFNKIAALKNNFTRIANTPKFVPKMGDIVVWGKSLNGDWGHIAIATGEGSTTWFNSYDQNWYGNHGRCERITHDYSHVLGVLRAKDQSKITGSKPKVKTKPKLESSGYKLGDKTIGVLSLKMLLLLAYKKKLISTKVAKDIGYGDGTKKAVNQLLNKWGYQPTGVAGEKFIKKLHTELEKLI